MNESIKKLNFLTSYSLLFFVLTISVVLFKFFDVYIFQLTRSFHGIFFSFFKNFIDPISDILDPLNIIIICLIILFANLNINSILKNPSKLKILETKTGFDFLPISNTFSYSSLVCKHIVFSLITAGVACNLLKYVVGVERPKYFFLGSHERINSFNIEHKVNSFPSGHTQAAFTIAMLFILYFNRHIILILIVATLMGISRIFMSMHFPSDIFFGAYLGSIFPVLIYKFFFKQQFEEFEEKNIMSTGDFLKLIYWRIFI